MSERKIEEISGIISRIDARKYNVEAFNELYSLVHDKEYFQKSTPFTKKGVMGEFELSYRNNIFERHLELRNNSANKAYRIKKNYLTRDKFYTVWDISGGKEVLLEKSLVYN